MPNFAPNSIIYLGNVPFDNSYRHTMTFANATEQAAYFSSVCNRALDNSSYTYVRMNNSIRVPFNAEELYTYDYCMYKNANYGNKWFYAFIVGVNYVNENMTEIELELDVMQTWYFDYTLVQGFVEREHVNDDTRGLHLNAEPPMDLQYQKYIKSMQDNYPKFIVLLVTAVPNYKYYTNMAQGNMSFESFGMPTYNKILKNDGSFPVSGGIIQKQFSSVIPLIYNMSSDASMNTLLHDIQCFNVCGIGDAIVDMFSVPEGTFEWNDDNPTSVMPIFYFNDYEQENDSANDHEAYRIHYYDTNAQPQYTVITRYTLPKNGNVYHDTERLAWGNNVGNYTPKNNKLLVYPYKYIEIGDYTGRKQDLRFEYFDNLYENEEAEFRVEKPCNAEGTGYITPLRYQGGYERKACEPFTFSYTNKLPWSYSVYQNWSAQNQLVNQLAVIGGLATTTVAVVPGIAAAGKVLGKGLQAAERLHGAAQQKKIESTVDKAAGQFKSQANLVGMGVGLASVAGVIGSYDKMSRIPNEARGNTAGNSKAQCGYQEYYIARVYLREEFARIVDDFFSMYGYAIDRVKVPNRTGRRNWNYVKMQNSCHRGNVPADQMDIINSIYDKGITFWHTSDVGNYSLDNSIVS